MKFLIFNHNFLGDTLMSTPFIHNLKNSAPHAVIDVITSPVGKKVLQNNPFINNIYLYNELKIPFFKKKKI